MLGFFSKFIDQVEKYKTQNLKSLHDLNIHSIEITCNRTLIENSTVYLSNFKHFSFSLEIHSYGLKLLK